MFGHRLIILATLTILALAVAGCQSKTARGDLSEKVVSFDQYPLVWLGASYDVDGDGNADPITTARTVVSPAFYHPLTGALIKPEIRTFTLSYGTCKIPDGATACPIPLTMVYSSPCATYPLSDIAKKRSVNVRGVDAIVEVNGNVRLETADFTLTIGAVASTEDGITQKALRIANDLVPANAKAKLVLKGSDFRPKPTGLCQASNGAATPVSVAPSANSCCSLQLDMDPATAGVQSSRIISGAQDEGGKGVERPWCSPGRKRPGVQRFYDLDTSRRRVSSSQHQL